MCWLNLDHVVHYGIFVRHAAGGDLVLQKSSLLAMEKRHEDSMKLTTRGHDYCRVGIVAKNFLDQRCVFFALVFFGISW